MIIKLYVETYVSNLIFTEIFEDHERACKFGL